VLICVLGMVGGRAIEIRLSEKGALAKKRLGNTVFQFCRRLHSKELPIHTYWNCHLDD